MPASCSPAPNVYSSNAASAGGEGGRRPRFAQRRDRLAAGRRVGRPNVCHSSAVRPARVAISASSAGRAARGVCASDTSEAWQKRRSADVQKPAGEIAVAVATAPRRASSSAIAPPIELPATCGRPSPSAAKNRSNASA